MLIVSSDLVKTNLLNTKNKTTPMNICPSAMRTMMSHAGIAIPPVNNKKRIFIQNIFTSKEIKNGDCNYCNNGE